MIAFLKRLFGRKAEPVEVPTSMTIMELGDDPLDPHGDGTLRPGDPIFDLMMGGGGAVLMNRRDDGKWEVERFPFNEGDQ